MGDDAPTDERLIAEQIAYYRARAPEYEFWWERSHQYQLDESAKAVWDEEVALVESWVDRQRPVGDVLELACGTGIWTRRLLRQASTITAVDASPEVLALNRDRLQPAERERVRFVEADLFEWCPDRRYDVVFFSFWLSHVPPSRLGQFWRLVADTVGPGGRALFIDNRFSRREWPYIEPDSYVQERSDISSGERFQIIKRYLGPDQLDAEMLNLGWHGRTVTTERFFIYGSATLRSDDVLATVEEGPDRPAPAGRPSG